MTFNEQISGNAQLKGTGWRRLNPPQTTPCYMASTWLNALAINVNDETKEIRIVFPPHPKEIKRLILDASHYQRTPSLFAQQEADILPAHPVNNPAVPISHGKYLPLLSRWKTKSFGSYLSKIGFHYRRFLKNLESRGEKI